MGSKHLNSLITISLFLLGVSADTYPQAIQGVQNYPNYFQQPYSQQPYQQYQLPYQQYPLPYQSHQLPYQQYGVSYGYPQYQPSTQQFQQYQQSYQQYPQFYQQYQQPSQQYQYALPAGYSNYQPSTSEGKPTFNYLNQYSPEVSSYLSNYPSNLKPVENTTVSKNKIEKQEASVPDPFAAVKTEIIDVEPEYFNYLMRFHNLQPQVQSQHLQSIPRRAYHYQPTYNITVGTNQYNHTSVPEVIKKHDVQHKTFSFKKTYIITPENRNQKIHLNFVNGVPVTETAERYKETATEVPVTESEPIETTTVDENPVNPQNRRFIEVPSSCPEGTKWVGGVGCLKKFSLQVPDI